MNGLARFTVVAAASAMLTWFAGWWAVPVVALAAGLFGMRAGVVAAACAIAWALLLTADVIAGGMGRLSSILAGVMGLPAPALFVVTLLFPLLLGWSAASLGGAARSLRSTSRQPS
jgi:hypothetical protein